MSQPRASSTDPVVAREFTDNEQKDREHEGSDPKVRGSKPRDNNPEVKTSERKGTAEIGRNNVVIDTTN